MFSKKNFPSARELTFLNHAGMSAMSMPALNEVIGISKIISKHGSTAGAELEKFLNDSRCSIAELINSEPAKISFIKNTTDGISMIASGLELGPGDNVVVPLCEYPSNIYNWLLLRERGVEVRLVGSLDDAPALPELLSIIDDRTKVVAISYVQFHSGSRAPIAGLIKAVGKKVLVVVDGVQAIGALQVDVKKEGIDCIIAGAHKWLLGPPGIGFIHMSARARKLVKPTRVGWATVRDSDDLPDMKMRFNSDGRRYEDGTYNFAGIAGMAASARLFTEIGMDEVQKLVLLNADLVKEHLGFKGVTFKLGDGHSESGIVSLRVKGRNSAFIASRLIKEGLIVKERRGHVRISPHFYNDKKDLLKLAREFRRLI